MDKTEGSTSSNERRTLAENIGAKAERKLNAKADGRHSIWFGLGMMGLIGWSVVVPTLAGAALGMWLDKHDPAKKHWTLTLMVAGLSAGCINAWLWVDKEDKAIHEQYRKRKNDDE